ncbi:hypothetical protein [Sphingomicrobium clamense]|uniref:Uncharacterized protein n=1 Tax=Sphingomicrobium clamense TaxID=2851013 RepID=A0ABS6V3U9_9SPHN|nr:hypothetical protein [Sphingomicrobium sp. B8]MBW0144226.1 hypothetical protein [Sphingomicrobium sp. B8]
MKETDDMTLLIASLVFASGGAALLWRLSSCPVLRTLSRGMGSWAARCEEMRSEDPAIVHAARQVA